VGGVFVFRQNRKFKSDLVKKEEDARYKMYEITILNELGDKIDYSLSVQNIIEVITKYLSEFINYSSVSYMLFLPEKITYKVNLKESVSHKFVDKIRAKMLDSISVLLNTDFRDKKVEEILLGTAINEELCEQVGSFFNIPLVISGKVVGILTVANTRNGFYKREEMATLYKIAQQGAEAVTRLQRVIDSENSKLNAMVTSMAEGVIMTDMDYKILVVNPAARRAVGLENKSDLSVSDFMEGLNGKFDLRDKIEESIRLDKVFLSDEVFLPSGFFQIAVSPVKYNWRTLGCVVIFRDITREKEVEKIKEDFTSMIVHELRSPLDSIKKMVELMRVSEIKKAKRLECFQMIYGSSSDMLELINNLLDIAKIEAGKFQLTKQKSDIKKIVESRILFFDIAAKDAKVKITSCFGKDIPNSVEFDPHTISQVLNNLISNAIKFSKVNGSVVVQILFHKKGGGLKKEADDSGINWFIKNDILDIPDSLLIAVTDSGIGISLDQINKLFNKFFQAKSIFIEKGGTGLGLAITKSIIDSHGGAVGVESIEGQGSTFYFTLPIN
jgi:signal transduction histidine kinase